MTTPTQQSRLQANSSDSAATPGTQIFVLTPAKLQELGYVTRIENGKTILVPKAAQSNIVTSKPLVTSEAEKGKRSLSSSSVADPQSKPSLNESPGRRRILYGFSKHWISSLENEGFITCPLRLCTYISLRFEDMCQHYAGCNGLANNTKFLCNVCKCCLHSKDDLRTHLKRTHNNKDKSTCSNNQDVQEAQKQEEHSLPEEKKISMSIPLCVRKRGHNKVHKHVWTNAIAEHGHVQCHFQNCNFMALSLEEMIDHYRSCNLIPADQITLYQCPHCKGRVSSEEKLAEHLKRSHDGDPGGPTSKKNLVSKHEPVMGIRRMDPSASGASEIQGRQTNEGHIEGEEAIDVKPLLSDETTRLTKMANQSFTISKDEVEMSIPRRSAFDNSIMDPLLTSMQQLIKTSPSRGGDKTRQQMTPDRHLTLKDEPASPTRIGLYEYPRQSLHKTNTAAGVTRRPVALAMHSNVRRAKKKVCSFWKGAPANKKICKFWKNTSLVEKRSSVYARDQEDLSDVETESRKGDYQPSEADEQQHGMEVIQECEISTAPVEYIISDMVEEIVDQPQYSDIAIEHLGAQVPTVQVHPELLNMQVEPELLAEQVKPGIPTKNIARELTKIIPIFEPCLPIAEAEKLFSMGQDDPQLSIYQLESESPREQHEPTFPNEQVESKLSIIQVDQDLEGKNLTSELPSIEPIEREFLFEQDDVKSSVKPEFPIEKDKDVHKLLIDRREPSSPIETSCGGEAVASESKPDALQIVAGGTGSVAQQQKFGERGCENLSGKTSSEPLEDAADKTSPSEPQHHEAVETGSEPQDHMAGETESEPQDHVVGEAESEPQDHVAGGTESESQDHVAEGTESESQDHVAEEAKSEPHHHTAAETESEPEHHVVGETESEPQDHMAEETKSEPQDHVVGETESEPQDHMAGETESEPQDHMAGGTENESHHTPADTERELVGPHHVVGDARNVWCANQCPSKLHQDWSPRGNREPLYIAAYVTDSKCTESEGQNADGIPDLAVMKEPCGAGGEASCKKNATADAIKSNASLDARQPQLHSVSEPATIKLRIDPVRNSTETVQPISEPIEYNLYSTQTSSDSVSNQTDAVHPRSKPIANSVETLQRVNERIGSHIESIRLLNRKNSRHLPSDIVINHEKDLIQPRSECYRYPINSVPSITDPVHVPSELVHPPLHSERVIVQDGVELGGSISQYASNQLNQEYSGESVVSIHVEKEKVIEKTQKEEEQVISIRKKRGRPPRKWNTKDYHVKVPEPMVGVGQVKTVAEISGLVETNVNEREVPEVISGNNFNVRVPSGGVDKYVLEKIQQEHKKPKRTMGDAQTPEPEVSLKDKVPVLSYIGDVRQVDRTGIKDCQVEFELKEILSENSVGGREEPSIVFGPLTDKCKNLKNTEAEKNKAEDVETRKTRRRTSLEETISCADILDQYCGEVQEEVLFSALEKKESSSKIEPSSEEKGLPKLEKELETTNDGQDTDESIGAKRHKLQVDTADNVSKCSTSSLHEVGKVDEHNRAVKGNLDNISPIEEKRDSLSAENSSMAALPVLSLVADSCDMKTIMENPETYPPVKRKRGRPSKKSLVPEPIVEVVNGDIEKIKENPDIAPTKKRNSLSAKKLGYSVHDLAESGGDGNNLIKTTVENDHATIPPVKRKRGRPPKKIYFSSTNDLSEPKIDNGGRQNTVEYSEIVAPGDLLLAESLSSSMAGRDIGSCDKKTMQNSPESIPLAKKKTVKEPKQSLVSSLVDLSEHIGKIDNDDLQNIKDIIAPIKMERCSRLEESFSSSINIITEYCQVVDACVQTKDKKQETVTSIIKKTGKPSKKSLSSSIDNLTGPFQVVDICVQLENKRQETVTSIKKKAGRPSKKSLVLPVIDVPGLDLVTDNGDVEKIKQNPDNTPPTKRKRDGLSLESLSSSSSTDNIAKCSRDIGSCEIKETKKNQETNPPVKKRGRPAKKSLVVSMVGISEFSGQINTGDEEKAKNNPDIIIAPTAQKEDSLLAENLSSSVDNGTESRGVVDICEQKKGKKQESITIKTKAGRQSKKSLVSRVVDFPESDLVIDNGDVDKIEENPDDIAPTKIKVDSLSVESLLSSIDNLTESGKDVDGCTKETVPLAKKKRRQAEKRLIGSEEDHRLIVEPQPNEDPPPRFSSRGRQLRPKQTSYDEDGDLFEDNPSKLSRGKRLRSVEASCSEDYVSVEALKPVKKRKVLNRRGSVVAVAGIQPDTPMPSSEDTGAPGNVTGVEDVRSTLENDEESTLAEDGDASVGDNDSDLPIADLVGKRVTQKRVKKRRGRKSKKKVRSTEVKLEAMRAPQKAKPKSAFAEAEDVAEKLLGPLSANSVMNCGKCGLEMKYAKFKSHCRTVHCGLAWIQGYPPLDLSDSAHVRYNLLKFWKPREKKVIVCETCGTFKRSIEGFISHVELTCQKSYEEQEALKVPCPVCGRFMMKSSLKVHMGTTHKSGLPEELDQPRPRALGKRAAATKAENLVLKYMKEESGNGQHHDDDDEVLLYRCRGGAKQRVHHVTKRYRRDIAVRGTAACINAGCSFESSSVFSLRNHYKKCSFIPALMYTCKVCRFFSGSESEMRGHVKTQHPDADPSDLARDSDAAQESDLASDYAGNSGSNSDFEDFEVREEPQLPERGKCVLTLQKPMKFTAQIKFLADKYCHRTRGDRPYSIATKWTLQFQEENYVESLFDGLQPTLVDWADLPEEAAARHLPVAQESMPVAHLVNDSAAAHEPHKLDDSVWSRLRLFESAVIDKVPVFFAGGPVWAMAWLPIPIVRLVHSTVNVGQVLAVSCHVGMDDVYTIDSSHAGPGLIQLWQFSHLDNTRSADKPAMVLGLAHNYGTVWHLEWCPSGCYQNLQEHPGRLSRMGLLAAACSDGAVHIFSVPFPAQLQPATHKLCAATPVVSLLLGRSAAPAMCSRLSWHRGLRHRYVAASYSSGLVGVWDLEATSPWLTETRDRVRIIYPHIVFQAHLGPVTALSLCPYGEFRYLLTGGPDRATKVWDLHQSPPVVISGGAKGCVTNGVWLTHWLSALTVYDDAFGIHHTNTMLQPMRNFGFTTYPFLAHNSPVWSISASDWSNAVAQGTSAGELCVIFPHQLFIGLDTEKGMKDKRMVISYIEMIDACKKVGSTTDSGLQASDEASNAGETENETVNQASNSSVAMDIDVLQSSDASVPPTSPPSTIADQSSALQTSNNIVKPNSTDAECTIVPKPNDSCVLQTVRTNVTPDDINVPHIITSYTANIPSVLNPLITPSVCVPSSENPIVIVDKAIVPCTVNPVRTHDIPSTSNSVITPSVSVPSSANPPIIADKTCVPSTVNPVRTHDIASVVSVANPLITPDNASVPHTVITSDNASVVRTPRRNCKRMDLDEDISEDGKSIADSAATYQAESVTDSVATYRPSSASTSMFDGSEDVSVFSGTDDFYLNERSCLTDGGSAVANLQHGERRFLPDSYADITKRFKVAFCNLALDAMKAIPNEARRSMRMSEKMRSVPPEMYPITSINRVSWNPNCTSHLWLASGYQCGVVRVPCVQNMYSKFTDNLLKAAYP